MMRPKWPNQIVNDNGSNMFERFDIVEIPWAQPKTHTPPEVRVSELKTTMQKLQRL